MKATAAVSRWISPVEPTVQGFELASPPLAPSDVGQALAQLGREGATDAAFVLVRLATTDSEGVRVAIHSAQDHPVGTRICLGIDGPTLRLIESGFVRNSQVGLALAGVDADTPLSAIVRSEIEAVCFKPEFVSRAMRDMRTEASLRAMVSLAHDLGLRTLGQGLEGERCRSEAISYFDYTATAPASHLSR